MIIRCTRKLAHLMALKQSDLISNLVEISPMGEWYANLFYLDRKKCLLFTNAKTLFTFIVSDIKKSQLKDIGRLFRTELQKAMIGEGFEESAIQAILEDCQSVCFGKSIDRTVLGIMVDHVKNVKWIVYYGHWHITDARKINHHVNTTPLLFKKGAYSIELLGAHLGIPIDTKLL